MEIHKKTWGFENWLCNNNLYCGKLLHIEQNKFCSLHFHKIKTEDFYVLNGSIQLTTLVNDERKTIILKQGDSVHIEPNISHRFTGLDYTNILIEISTQHFEDDSYRLEPSYMELK